MTNPFKTTKPHITGNAGIRTPQVEAFVELEKFAGAASGEREVGVILPVGCGKSGCIALAPFAFESRRTLVVAPGLTIANQLHKDFDPAHPDMFYKKSGALAAGPFPEPVEIRGTTTNRSDLDEAHVVVTNIQQLQGTTNAWLNTLPADYFDLILFDEGHHNVADSWETLKKKFPEAKIVNFSATPLRADGQLMAGRIIYSYPIYRAIQEGYIKRLKAVVLNPRTLKYVRREDGAEVEVSLEEVRRLGEEDADFRRSIVSSKVSLDTIVDCSIRELQRLRAESGESRLKIIASALNFEHCRQVVEAYKARGLRVAYVHSREDAAANKRVMEKLEAHELDVIVQVRKLGEGFDHRHLAVAAVFSIFANLSPFIQFVGRIMRVVKQNAPHDLVNRGVVVFHAGSNIARQWNDFQTYSEADQAYFDQLLPLEGMDVTSGDELSVEPVLPEDRDAAMPDIKHQEGLQLEEIPLIADDPEAAAAIKLLLEKGYSADQVKQAMELEPVPVTKVRARQAKRDSLDVRVRTAAARILGERSVNPEGKELDGNRLGRSNLIVLKAAIDREVNTFVGKGGGSRHEFSRDELDRIEKNFEALTAKAVEKIFNG